MSAVKLSGGGKSSQKGNSIKQNQVLVAGLLPSPALCFITCPWKLAQSRFHNLLFQELPGHLVVRGSICSHCFS